MVIDAGTMIRSLDSGFQTPLSRVAVSGADHSLTRPASVSLSAMPMTGSIPIRFPMVVSVRLYGWGQPTTASYMITNANVTEHIAHTPMTAG